MCKSRIIKGAERERERERERIIKWTCKSEEGVEEELKNNVDGEPDEKMCDRGNCCHYKGLRMI